MTKLQMMVDWIAKNVDPRPILDYIETHYGIIARYMAILLVCMVAILMFGYSLPSVRMWFGL